MQIKKLSMLLLSALSCAALLNGCGSSSKEGNTGTGGAALVAEGTCITCHSTTVDSASGTNIVTDYANSAHNPATDQGGSGCQGCHGGGAQHNGVGPIPFPNPLKLDATGKPQCTNVACHGAADSIIPGVVTTENTHLNFPGECSQCHTTTPGKGGIHAAQVTASALNDPDDCVFCHSVAAPQHGALVNDNSGVRNIVAEFGKWSHHVSPGVTLNKAHCAACHLEGTASNGAIVIDHNKHMVDNIVHLRNGNDDTDLQWDPMNPNHTTMDTFCLSCHDAGGAISPVSIKIQTIINAKSVAAPGKIASPTNPFGDNITNQYDLMQRPAVVDVKSQFATTNPSHHAVLGQRYSGRTRTAGARVIANTGKTGAKAFLINSTATLPGPRTTIYDAGKFNATYKTLSPAPGTTDSTLGDDSILHCADCHTVGQWKPGSATNAQGFNTYSTAAGKNTLQPAIGAHGSNNEYMLRNSIGSDARHQGIQLDSNGAFHQDTVTPYLVCYNCHAITSYGTGNHDGEQFNSAGEGNCDASVNTNSVNLTGAARLQDIFTMTDGLGAIFGAPTGAARGNIYGIQCNNCHNSGISAGNIFGGIHGSKDLTYTDGAGNTTKHERFLPGLGNVMYVPGTQGGITGGTTATVTSTIAPFTYTFTTGGTTNDANWEENNKVRVVGIKGGGAHPHQAGPAGCYTITDSSVPIPATDQEGTGITTVTGVTSIPGITGVTTPASQNLTAPNGQLLFGNWGGCADHQQAPGTSVRAPRNGNTSIRPVTY